MNINKIRLLSIITVFALTMGTSMAEATQINVQDLFKGNTAFGKQLKWGLSISVLFRHNGEIIVVDERGQTEKGTWWSNNRGELCTKFKQESCRKVSKHASGAYLVHNETNDKLVDWSLAEIAKGNPYGIK